MPTGSREKPYVLCVMIELKSMARFLSFYGVIKTENILEIILAENCRCAVSDVAIKIFAEL